METQLGLFDEDAVDSALRRLGPHAAQVSLSFRDTRRQLFAWRREADSGAVHLRVHRVFRSAPDDVADALVRLVLRRLPRDEKRALRHRVNAWFSGQRVAVAPAARLAPPPSVARGLHVDLRAAFERMRAERLPGFEADLAWSESATRRIMGRFERGHPRARIVVNRLLDAPLAPAWYLDFLLFHEALHGVHPPRPGRARMIIHTAEFRRDERSHPHVARARVFERWATGRGFKHLVAAAVDRKLLPVELR